MATEKQENPRWTRLKKFIAVNIWVQKIRMQSFGWWYYIDTGFKVFSRITPLITGFIGGLIINELIRLAASPVKDLTTLYTLLGYYAGVLVINTIISQLYYNNNWLYGGYAFRIWLSNAIIGKLTELNWEHIETPKMETNINMTFDRSREHIEYLATIHIDIVALLISTVLAIEVARISALILLILFIKELPSVLRSAYANQKSYQLDKELMPINIRFNQIMNYFRDFRTLLEVKVSQAAYQLQKIRDTFFKFSFGQYRKLQRKLTPLGLIINSVDQLVEVGIYVYYINQAIFNGLPIGTFQYITNTTLNISSSIYSIMSRITSMLQSYRYIAYAYDLLSMKNTTPDGTKEFDARDISIEFRDVWFKYPGSHRYALKDINLKIENHDKIAIVGENGAGKTTFLKLLMLIYYPTKGTILINGTPLQEYKRDSLYKIISLVSQDFARYDMLEIKQNIAIYGDPLNPDIKKVEAAAEQADAASFIDALPNKYETVLSKKVEGGTELSTGQWQRIAVARQFYGDRPLVILDEPTASIDPVAEAKIFYNLYHHVQEKTVIVVSHRYNTVRSAREILVFRDGQIIERGSHEELLDLGGYYADAYQLQQEEKRL